MQKEYDYEYSVDLPNLINLHKNRNITPEQITGCFDWLSCTFNCFTYEYENLIMRPILDSVSQNKIKSLLYFFGKGDKNIESYTIENGANGFRYKITIDEGAYLLFYGPETIGGVHATALNLSGVACQRLIQTNMFVGLLEYCFHWGYRFTRFDCAIDDYSDIFPLALVNDLVRDRCYVSQFKKPFRVNGTPNPDSVYGYDGVTYYLGNESDLLLRIYAKNWKEEKQEEIKNWTRFEVQIRDHERIKQLVTMIILGYKTSDYSNYFGVVAGILKEVVMFKVPGKNKQKTRWEDHPAYLKFLHDVKSIKLFHAPKGKSNYEKTMEWIKKGCSLFLTQFYLVEGKQRFNDFIKYMITERFFSMQENDFNMVYNELASRNEVFSYEKAYREMKDMQQEFNRYDFDSSLKTTPEYEEELKKIKEDEENG